MQISIIIRHFIFLERKPKKDVYRSLSLENQHVVCFLNFAKAVCGTDGFGAVRWNDTFTLKYLV